MRILRSATVLVLLLSSTPINGNASPEDAGGLPVKLYIRKIRLDARDIGYDPATKRLFASVGPNVSGRANSITAIDPLTGVLGSSTFVGSEPGRIAVIPEGGTLYVMLNGAQALCRFDTLLRKPVKQFPANVNIEDMIVPAHHPDWVVTSNYNPGLSPRHGGGSLYVDGKGQQIYQWGPNVFINTPDGDHLYGLYNEFRGGSGIGARPLNPPGSAGGWGINVQESAGDIKYEQGKLFASSGRIYDFENPGLLGSCAADGLVAPEAKANRVYFLMSAARGAWQFKAFDTRMFTAIGSMEFTGMQGAPTRLVKWGPDSYAIRTDASEIVFISPFPDLFNAAKAVDTASLKLLLNAGANPNGQNEEGKTPLMLAAGAGRLEACVALLARGADSQMRDFRDGTALMSAAEQGSASIVALLAKGGTGVNLARQDGQTALHLAAINGHVEAVGVLLDHGANINARSNNKRTALMDAILTSKLAVARLLIARHADVNAKADNGDSALKIAAAEGRTELIPLLRKAGARD